MTSSDDDETDGDETDDDDDDDAGGDTITILGPGGEPVDGLVDELEGELEVDLDAEDAAVLRDVQQALTDLADLDLELTDPADLDRARQELPTDPERAELLAAALPAPLANSIEYVNPCDRQAGYWRRSPDRSIEAASTAQLRHRLAFTQANIDNRGETGTIRTEDGRRIARTAHQVGTELRGASFDDPHDHSTDPDSDSDPDRERERERGGKLLSSIRRFLR